MLGRLLDVIVLRGEGGGLSDLFFGGSSAEIGGWLEDGGCEKCVEVSELNHAVKERAYQESLREKYVWRGRECREEVGKVERYSSGVYQ